MTDGTTGVGRAAPVHLSPCPKQRVGAPAWALLGLLAVGAAVIVATVGDYGVSWDENVQHKYGEAVLRYLLTWGKDRSCDEMGPLRFYGPVFELATAAIARQAPPDALYTIRHAAVALTGLLAVGALWRVGRFLGSAWVGLLGGVALVTMPLYYGHAFVNSKDIPFACLYAWTMALTVERFAAGHWTWRSIAVFGLVLGLLGGVRPGGMVVAGASLVAVFAWASLSGAPARTPPWRRRFLGGLAVGLVVAWSVMVLPWPYAHGNPLVRPLDAIMTALRFPWEFQMLFAGEVVSSDHLPRRYLLQYLLITTPPLLLVGAVGGIIAAVFEQVRRPRSRQSLVLAVLEVWLLLPLLLFVIQPPHVYDGIRHYLFLLPALALWYAWGAARMIACARHTRVRQAVAAGVALVTLIPIWSLVGLHPYEMTYFNSLVGGLRGADGKYETDYWLTSFREAMEWINAQAARQPDRTFTVLLATRPNTLETVRPFKRANIQIRALPRNHPAGDSVPDGVDYAILTTRTAQAAFARSPIVHTVGREGAVFCVVRAPAAPHERAAP